MALPLWQTVVYAVLTLVLMFGMGASLTPDVFRGVLQRPTAFFGGLGCQFVALPLLGLAAARGLALAPSDTLGLMLMVTVGGGNASNMLSYLVRADVALSLSMTVAATFASIALTPVWLSLVAGEGSAVPLRAVAVTVTMMAVPVPLGMALRARSPAVAAGIDRAGRLAGFALLGIILATGAADVLGSIATAPAAVFAACGLVSGGGMLLGSGLGYLLGVPRVQWLAMGLETGVQNLPAALAIVIGAFPADQHAALQRTPLLYATVALLLGALWCVLHRPR
ncbi:MAG: hypothetical protein AAF602_21250 [Myxococcota bacterium]